MIEWKVTIDGQSMNLNDLSEDDFTEIAEKHPSTNWLRIYQSPASHTGAFYDLLCLCALRMKKPSPDRAVNVKDFYDRLMPMLSEATDDLPKEFSPTGIPLPEADDKATTSSSTSTEPEDGVPTK